MRINSLNEAITKLEQSMTRLEKQVLSEKERSQAMERALTEIAQVAEETLAIPGTPGKALISISWIRKLAARAIGKETDD